MQTTAAVRVRLRIDFGKQSAVGPGKIALLEAIAHSGSLSQAATALGMSYRRAWALLRDLNQEFDEPVSIASVGGVGGGGAQVTPFAAELIAAYRAVERAALAAAVKRFEGLVSARAHARQGSEAKPPRRSNKRKPAGRRAN